jgi:hypothetical protein
MLTSSELMMIENGFLGNVRTFESVPFIERMFIRERLVQRILQFNTRYYGRDLHRITEEIYSNCSCAIYKATKKHLKPVSHLYRDAPPFIDVKEEMVRMVCGHHIYQDSQRIISVYRRGDIFRPSRRVTDTV